MSAGLAPRRWSAPGGHEWALACDGERRHRLLIVPALFEEANRLRRLSAELMRRLDARGIDCLLPDLPGCNDSAAPLAEQTPATWQAAMAAVAAQFAATHVLAMRGGALVAPTALPGWRYAPAGGAALLRPMLRARVIAAREAGREEATAPLLATGRRDGIELAGYRLSAAFIDAFADLALPAAPRQRDIVQDQIGGGGLWLRAEPGENAAQADALAAIVAAGMAA